MESCRKILDFFVQPLYRIPGNGQKTFLWHDKSNGHDPLHEETSTVEFQNWLLNKGIHKLSDIASWDAKGNWFDWSFPPMTERDLPNSSAQ